MVAALSIRANPANFEVQRKRVHVWKDSLNQHIYLTGYRGSGKSTVGRILANSTELPFVDLDDEVERAAGVTIREIFANHGESKFRDLETQCLELVAKSNPTVVALGGGAILRQENRDLICESGICFWLVADAKALLERICADPASNDRRPALTEMPMLEEIESILQQRHPMYEAAADHQINVTQLSAQSVVDQIRTIMQRSADSTDC